MKSALLPVQARRYKPFTLAQVATRPGSLAILVNPSRFGGTLHYPDGRTVDDPK